MRFKHIVCAALFLFCASAYSQDSRYKVGAVEMGYQPQEVFMIRVPEVKAFTDFIFDAAPIIEKHLMEHPPEDGSGGLILVVVKPNGAIKIWTMFGANNTPLATEDDLAKAMADIKVFPVSQGPIALGIKAERFGERGVNKLRVPAQWIEVVRSQKLSVGPYLVDKIIQNLWPD